MVRMVNVPPDRRQAPEDSHMYGPAQKSKWEVYIDDVLRGYVFYPLGVNQGWKPMTLAPKPDYYGGYTPTRAWLPPDGEYGGWGEGGMWDGLMGLLQPLTVKDVRMGNTYWEPRRWWKDRASCAGAFVAAMKGGKAPDPVGVEKMIVDGEAEKVRRAKKAAEDKARVDREIAADRARRDREAAEAEELRQETLMGLESILERFGGAGDDDKLRNLERVALCRAIETFGGKIDGA